MKIMKIKKSLTAIFILIFLILTVRAGVAFFEFKIPEIPKPDIPKIESSDWIFADPDCSQARVNFSPGDQVYLKIETFNDGEQQRTVKLLNSQKETLSTFALQREGNNPFIFKQSFPAPNEEGIFYLHLDIKGDGGSVYVAESNINVGKTSGEVKSEAFSEVNIQSDGQAQTETFEEDPTVDDKDDSLSDEDRVGDPIEISLTPTPTPYLRESMQEILDAYVNFFRYLFNFFKNLLFNS